MRQGGLWRGEGALSIQRVYHTRAPAAWSMQEGKEGEAGRGAERDQEYKGEACA